MQNEPDDTALLVPQRVRGTGCGPALEHFNPQGAARAQRGEPKFNIQEFSSWFRRRPTEALRTTRSQRRRIGQQQRPTNFEHVAWQWAWHRGGPNFFTRESSTSSIA